MRANPWNDQVAMYFLSIGVIEVDEEGKIWKVKDKRGRLNHQWVWRDIEPRRIESEHEGYLRVGLCIHRILYHIFAHRIVWLTHYGLIPLGLEPNHKNGIKDDNRPENLELITHLENIIHSRDILKSKVLKGEQIGNSKLKEFEVLYMRKHYNYNKISYAALGRMYGVTGSTARHIIKKTIWKHI